MAPDAVASIRDTLRALDRGDYSARELTQYYLDRINQDPHNAFITVTPEVALAQAEAADSARASGQAPPLAGIPIAHKDIFCTRDIRTTAGSRMLDNFVSPFDATVVEQMSRAGTVCLGKTNMDEFAMGSSNETSYYGPTKNPWNPDLVPGGSSGGSASAVAAGLCIAATGTDTGGSIRQPAAFCGLTGIKPTYGRVSRWGMIAYASSLDQGGPIARSAEDAALILEAMAGHDPRDSTSVAQEVPAYGSLLDQPVAGLRIGICQEYFGDGLAPGSAALITAALRLLESRGAKLVDVSLPHTAYSIPAYYVIAPAEASTNLSRYDGVRFGYRCPDPVDIEDLYSRSRSEGFGAEVKQRIMVGAFALSEGYFDAYYGKAQQVRRLIRDDFAQVFTGVDLIAGPVSPDVAFPLGDKTNDPVAMYLQDIYTIASNLAGLPAMSLPVGFVNGLPVGMQLIGNYFDEARMLAAAHQFQIETDWHLQTPGGKAT
ncbi:MAG: Asp-tRNA(Asn)/Glu-tRNA(Gln) amidotransferase subunit GatA [Pseudomonadota bacterium]